MRNWMKKEIDILGYPYDMASSTMGARLGPESIRIAGLINGLRDIGYKVNDYGDIKLSNAYNLDDSDNVLKNFNLTLDAAKTTIPEISYIYKHGNFPLILGGDHSLVLSSGKLYSKTLIILELSISMPMLILILKKLLLQEISMECLYLFYVVKVQMSLKM